MATHPTSLHAFNFNFGRKCVSKSKKDILDPKKHLDIEWESVKMLVTS